MKQYKNSSSFLSHKAYYICLAIGFAVLATLMVLYSQQMKNKNDNANQEVVLDEVGNKAIQKTETTETSDKGTDDTESSTQTEETVYDGKTKLTWPVEGNVILPFSMDTTVYFQTLDQYKCNPAILIEAKEGQEVGAMAKCKVKDVTKDKEIGNQIVLDLGNDYTVVLGQLKNVKVKKGDALEVGDIIGNVASPTSYYTLEGNHLYMKMLKNNKPVNPVKYMKQ